MYCKYADNRRLKCELVTQATVYVTNYSQPSLAPQLDRSKYDFKYFDDRMEWQRNETIIYEQQP